MCDSPCPALDPELWGERFRLYLTNRRRPPTVERYVCHLRILLPFLERLGLTSLAGLTAEHLETYRQHLFERRYRGRAIAHSTVSVHLTAVKAFVRYLVRERYLLLNVASELELPSRRSRKLPLVLSEDEVERLLVTPDVSTPMGVRNRAMLEVLYGSAVRNAELRALKVEDVDGAEQLLRVHEGKGGRSRVVPLGDEAMAWIEEYLTVVRPRLCAGPEVPWLFLTRFGTRFSHATNLGAIVTAAARAAGLTQPVTPHTLRHCCATHMLARGAGLRQLQVFLGHASLASTQHYTTVELSALRKVLQRCHPRERQR